MTKRAWVLPWLLLGSMGMTGCAKKDAPLTAPELSGMVRVKYDEAYNRGYADGQRDVACGVIDTLVRNKQFTKAQGDAVLSAGHIKCEETSQTGTTGTIDDLTVTGTDKSGKSKEQP